MSTAGAEAYARSLVIDVDAYPDRVKVLDLLAQAYEVPSWAPNPMDGDLIQTQWQSDSGRSVLPWWNRINYCLTIWRLQALQSMGAFSNIRLEGKMQVRLPTGVRRQLLRYYAAVQRFRSGPGPSPWLLQALFWVVHSHTVIDATRAAKKLQSSLRDGERQFALGWGRIMVRVLAEANFSTAQAAVGPINQQCLPQRVCNASDIDPASPSDLPPAQRETVLAIARLYRARDWSFLYLPLLEIGAVILNCIMRVEQQFESGCSSIKNGGVP